MRRLLTLVAGGFLLIALFGFAPAALAGNTIATTTTCSNGVDNTGGLGLICEITVRNTFRANGGSATVTIRECHGAAGNPTAKCTTKTGRLTKPVTFVRQCNSSINGGGGTLRCSVRVINTFIGINVGSSSATVNQCVGSGGGITTGCDPFPATTTGAAITQCNGSANGGTLVGLTCTATGTRSSTRAVRISQCNGSANGGGALVICSASVSNSVSALSGGLPPTDSPAATIDAAPTDQAPLLALTVFLFAFVAFARRSLRDTRGR